MKKSLRQQLRSEPLPPDELSEKEQQLLRHLLDQELQQLLVESLEKKGVQRVPAAKFSWLTWTAYAAVFAALVLGRWYFLANPSATQMAKTYLETPLALDAVVRGDNTKQDTIRLQSQMAYQTGNYQAALEIIAPLLPEQILDDHLLAGLCNLYLERYTPATQHLETALHLDPSRYHDEIQWHLALAYTLNGDKNKALQHLQEILNSPTSRDKNQAKKLLKAL